MLVVERRAQQRIIFSLVDATDEEIARLRSGEEVIEVMLCAIRGDKARIGGTAPKGVVIDRAEIWERKRTEAA